MTLLDWYFIGLVCMFLLDIFVYRKKQDEISKNTPLWVKNTISGVFVFLWPITAVVLMGNVILLLYRYHKAIKMLKNG